MTKPKVSDWETLRDLIAEYAEAYVADSWKGGGDPASYAKIELSLKLQSERLDTHLAAMEKRFAS